MQLNCITENRNVESKYNCNEKEEDILNLRNVFQFRNVKLRDIIKVYIRETEFWKY